MRVLKAAESWENIYMNHLNWAAQLIRVHIVRYLDKDILDHPAMEKPTLTRRAMHPTYRIMKIINVYFFRPPSSFGVAYYARKSKWWKNSSSLGVLIFWWCYFSTGLSGKYVEINLNTCSCSRKEKLYFYLTLNKNQINIFI